MLDTNTKTERCFDRLDPLEQVVCSALREAPLSLIGLEDRLRQDGVLSRFWGTVKLDDVVQNLDRLGIVDRNSERRYQLTDLTLRGHLPAVPSANEAG